MKKDGKIILVDASRDFGEEVCGGLKAAGHKNECIAFTDSEEAAAYLRDNMNDVFMLLQSNITPAVELANTRNMVYMHEKFNSDRLPYMFLILTLPKEKANDSHKFVHAYYRNNDTATVTHTLNDVIVFWKDHVFPPKVRSFI